MVIDRKEREILCEELLTFDRTEFHQFHTQYEIGRRMPAERSAAHKVRVCNYCLIFAWRMAAASEFQPQRRKHFSHTEKGESDDHRIISVCEWRSIQFERKRFQMIYKANTHRTADSAIEMSQSISVIPSLSFIGNPIKTSET
jgi:hypothetical protein